MPYTALPWAPPRNLLQTQNLRIQASCLHCNPAFNEISIWSPCTLNCEAWKVLWEGQTLDWYLEAGACWSGVFALVVSSLEDIITTHLLGCLSDRRLLLHWRASQVTRAAAPQQCREGAASKVETKCVAENQVSANGQQLIKRQLKNKD